MSAWGRNDRYGVHINTPLVVMRIAYIEQLLACSKEDV
jgi:hypothetical protein